MKRDDFDLAPVILGNCGIIVCFRCRWPNDAEILSRVLMSGNLTFEPLMHEVERHAGHEFLQIDEHSETVKKDIGRSNTSGTTLTTGTNRVHTNGRSKAENLSIGTNSSVVTTPQGQELSRTRSATGTRASGLSDSFSDSFGASQTTGSTHNQTESESNGWAVTLSHKIVPLPVIVREEQETGMLKKSISDQFAGFVQHLHGLEHRHAMVLAPGMKQAIEIVTAEVTDPFQSIVTQMKAVEAVRHRLYDAHEYFFQPSLDPAETDRRVSEFVSPSKENGSREHRNGAASHDGHAHRSRAASNGEKNGNPLD